MKPISEKIQPMTRAALLSIPKDVYRPPLAKKAGVSPRWLWSFQLGATKKPAFEYVVKLYNYLISAYPDEMKAAELSINKTSSDIPIS